MKSKSFNPGQNPKSVPLKFPPLFGGQPFSTPHFVPEFVGLPRFTPHFFPPLFGEHPHFSNAAQTPAFNAQNLAFNAAQNPAAQNPAFNAAQNPAAQNPAFNAAQNPAFNAAQNPKAVFSQDNSHPSLVWPPPFKMDSTYKAVKTDSSTLSSIKGKLDQPPIKMDSTTIFVKRDSSMFEKGKVAGPVEMNSTTIAVEIPGVNSGGGKSNNKSAKKVVESERNKLDVADAIVYSVDNASEDSSCKDMEIFRIKDMVIV